MGKKIVILNEGVLNRLFSIVEANVDGKSQTFNDHMNYLKKYRDLGSGYFKNPSLENKDDDITYKEALKKEMDDIVSTIYTVYEKISHGGRSSVFDGPATNGRPDFSEFGGNKEEWMKAIKAYNTAKNSYPTGEKGSFYPGTYYVDGDILHNYKANKQSFMYKTRCYYTLIMRLYENGEPVWANLFFNPKYSVAMKKFYDCKNIATGTLARMSAGLPDENGNYPEGTLNWIRKNKYLSAKSYGNKNVRFTPLEHDIVPLTYKNTQFTDLIPKEEQDTILNWRIKAKANPQMYQKYLIDVPKPQMNTTTKAQNGRRTFVRRK